MVLQSGFAALAADVFHMGNVASTLVSLPAFVTTAGTVLRIWGTFSGYIYTDTLVDIAYVTGVIQATVDGGAPVGCSASHIPPSGVAPNLCLSFLIEVAGLAAGAHVIDLDWWSFTDTISGAPDPNHGTIETLAASVPGLYSASLYVQEMTP